MTARQRLIDTTSRLLQTVGYHNAGLNQIVAESGAPKGSLYHYFPGGKVELAVAALNQSSIQLAQALTELCLAHTDAASAMSAVLDHFIGEMERSAFAKGCPVATVTLEQAALTPEIGQACAQAYQLWQQGIEAYFASRGLRDAPALAENTLMLIEGGLLLSRAQRSCEPLHRLKSRLITLIHMSQGEA